MRKLWIIAVLVALIAPETRAADQSDAKKVFLFVQRTERHAKYSKPEVFHEALDDIKSYLKSKNVAIAEDEFGGRDHAEGAMPLETVFKIAAEAGASGLLYVVVDRPLTKWIKVEVTSYDADGKKLWQEEASNGAAMTGGGGFSATAKKLHEKLDKHVGQLPLGAVR